MPRPEDLKRFFSPEYLAKHLPASPAPPLLPEPPSRKQIIARGGTGYRIAVAPNPKVKAAAPWWELREASMVEDNARDIDEAARRYKLSPDLIRSVMHMETTHGYIEPPFGLNKSVRPMNINTKFWGDQWGSRENLRRPQANIDAGARMLRSIANAMPGASAAQIASVYNDSNAIRVSDYGARVQSIYETTAWLAPKPPRAPRR